MKNIYLQYVYYNLLVHILNSYLVPLVLCISYNTLHMLTSIKQLRLIADSLLNLKNIYRVRSNW